MNLKEFNELTRDIDESTEIVIGRITKDGAVDYFIEDDIEEVEVLEDDKKIFIIRG